MTIYSDVTVVDMAVVTAVDMVVIMMITMVGTIKARPVEVTDHQVRLDR